VLTRYFAYSVQFTKKLLCVFCSILNKTTLRILYLGKIKG